MDGHIVTVEDYDSRHATPVPVEDADRIQTLLDDAVSVIMADAAFALREGDEGQERVLSMVVCAMVERRLASESSGDMDGWSTQQSITTGPFSRTYTRPSPMAGMTLLPSERKALGMDDCAIGAIEWGC